MRESVRKGFSLCVPICVGVFAYAGVFGLLAAAKGVPTSLVALMGVLVFSGSAQFVIVDMWGSASLWTVLGAVASMNLRYLLICASVEPLFDGKSLFQRMFRAHLVADENWAVAMAAQAGESEKADILLAGGIALMLSWLAGSLAGRLAGGWIPAPERFGLDFAFPALFAALVVSLWKGKEDLLPFIVAASVTAAVDFLFGGSWSVRAGGVAGAGPMGWKGKNRS